jgi:hypothetical protein
MGRPGPCRGARAPCRGRSPPCRGRRVVDDRHHPVVGVVQLRQPLQGLARDRLLVAHRDQDHPGEAGRIRLTVAVRVVVLRPPPLVELERQRRRGDQDHAHRDDQEERVGEQRGREPDQQRGQEQHQQAAAKPGTVGRMAWTPGTVRGERPVLVRAEVHHAADHQQAPVGDGPADRRGHEREQADARKEARAPGDVESAPPAPKADLGAGDAPPPGEVTVGQEVELQGRDRLGHVRDGGGTPERDEQLQQSVTEERNRTPDQREQPLLPAPQCGDDPGEQLDPPCSDRRHSGHRIASTVTAREELQRERRRTGGHGG